MYEYNTVISEHVHTRTVLTSTVRVFLQFPLQFTRNVL